MAQLYFLSIVFNFIAGLILVVDGKKSQMNSTGTTGFDDTTDTSSGEGQGQGRAKKGYTLQDLAENKGFHFFIGTATFIIGVFKLLATYDGIVLVGDLLPALAGVVLGGMLFIDYFKSTTTITSDLIERLDEIFLKNKKYFGITGVAVAITHFIFPQIVLL